MLNWRGTDIYDHPLFREPLSRITQTRWPVSTDIFPLDGATHNPGVFFLQLVPVRSILPTSGPETIRSRGSYIGLLLDVNRLVRKSLTKFNRRDVNLFLFDQKNKLITSRGQNPNLPAENRTLSALKQRLGNDLFFHSNLQLYNKRWPVVASPGTDFWLSSYFRGSWVALASGLVITLLATGLLFSLLKWTRQNELQATVDHLTGLFNRRKFFRELDREIERAKRYSHSLSLLLLDLDNFKRINDIHGHPAGDRVLKNLGQIIEENTRESDLSARYGGEEFVILLPETDSHEALQLARRIKEEFSTLVFNTEEQTEFTATCSIGISTSQPASGEDFSLIEAADEALYQAKEAGKDRIVCC